MEKNLNGNKIEKLNKQQKGFAIHSFLQPHANLNEKGTQVQGRIQDSQMKRGSAQYITKDYTSRALSVKSLKKNTTGIPGLRKRPGSSSRFSE